MGSCRSFRSPFGFAIKGYLLTSSSSTGLEGLRLMWLPATVERHLQLILGVKRSDGSILNTPV